MFVLFCSELCSSIQLFLLAPNIRIKETHPYNAYVQIKDGSTWRYIVVSKMWNKTLSKMLCHHLGFNAMENDLSSSQCGKGCKIASGDVVCYNSHPSRTSCCVHLQPSIARENVLLPYARCKYTCFMNNYIILCLEPMLHVCLVLCTNFLYR